MHEVMQDLDCTTAQPRNEIPEISQRHEDLMTRAKLVDESADCQLFPSNFLEWSLLRVRALLIRSERAPASNTALVNREPCVRVHNLGAFLRNPEFEPPTKRTEHPWARAANLRWTALDERQFVCDDIPLSTS